MKRILIFLLVCNQHASFGQQFYTSTDDRLILDNGNISKTIQITQDSLIATTLLIPASSKNFVIQSKEFSFNITPAMSY